MTTEKSGRTSYVGKDPFDGALKKAMTTLGIDTDSQRNFITRINSINQRYPNSLVGKNPTFIARALNEESKLPRQMELDSENLSYLFNYKEAPNITFTLIRYILWIRALDDLPISDSIFPVEWKDNIAITREAYYSSQPSLIAGDESDEDLI